MERFEIKDDVDEAFEDKAFRDSLEKLVRDMRIKQVYNGDWVVARRTKNSMGIHDLSEDKSIVILWDDAVELAKAILKENGAIMERERTPLRGLDGLSWPDDRQTGAPPVDRPCQTRTNEPPSNDFGPKITCVTNGSVRWSECAEKPDLDDWTSNDLTDGIRK